MPCRSPLNGYKLPDGSFSFNRTNSVGLISFACGMCRDCRINKAREWAIRCHHEASMHEDNCWLTLTYAKDPITVNRRDLQIFFKALRNAGFKFSYYAVGEYGENFSRPHYHVCLFGADFPDKYPWEKKNKSLLYRSPQLEKAWPHGHAKIGNLTQESAAYTARYTMKKITGDKAEKHYSREIGGLEFMITPEFALMSLKPPIGKRWIEKYYKDVFPADHVIYKGKEMPVPRYYYNWLQVEHNELWQEVQKKRIKHHEEKIPETGKEQFLQAVSRDHKYARLERSLEKIQ